MSITYAKIYRSENCQMKVKLLLRSYLFQTMTAFIFVLLFGNSVFAIEYGADISCAVVNVTKYDFQRMAIPLTIRNTGTKKWDSYAKKNPVYLSYHLLSKKDGQMISYDGVRTSFQEAVLPGETSLVDLQLPAFGVGGQYIIRVDLVAEDLTWFKAQGSEELDVILNILKSTAKVEKPKPELENYQNELVWYVDGEDEINYCSMLSKEVLKGNFKAEVSRFFC